MIWSVNWFRSLIGIAHFNEDNYFDLAVTNSGRNNIGFFLGIAFGIFSNEMILSPNDHSNPSYLVIGDLNNDDHFHLIVTNNGTANIRIFFRYGTFQSEKRFSIQSDSHPQYIYILMKKIILQILLLLIELILFFEMEICSKWQDMT